MPPRHRKGIADAMNPPEPDDPSKQVAEKGLLDRACCRTDRGAAVAARVTSLTSAVPAPR